MEFRIIKANLQFRERLQPLNLAKVDGIALHHMAHPTWTLEDVHRAHLARGWAGCGYNYWVAKDGTIYEARGLHVGAGISGHNSHLIHIGFQGDYERVDKEMPDAQFNAGVWLIQYLRQRVPTVRVVNGHRHWAATACPGRYFPLAEMLAGKYRGQQPAQPQQKATPSIPVYVNGKLVGQGVLIEDRTFVPVRMVAEALGATVNWDPKTKSVHIFREK